MKKKLNQHQIGQRIRRSKERILHLVGSENNKVPQRKLEQSKQCIVIQSKLEKDLLEELEKQGKIITSYKDAVDQDGRTIQYKNEEIDKLKGWMKQKEEANRVLVEDNTKLSDRIIVLENELSKRDNTTLQLKKEVNQSEDISSQKQRKLEEQTQLVNDYKEDQLKMMAQLEEMKKKYSELDKAKFDNYMKHIDEEARLNTIIDELNNKIRKLEAILMTVGILLSCGIVLTMLSVFIGG